MGRILEFITDEDEAALSRRARRVSFDDGAVILPEGERCRALFVLREGEAAVERVHGEYSVEISQLHAGEMFGEMGFVEDFPASASVVARGRCQVDVIGDQDIRDLIARDPLFAGRFYQSVASVLSRRLRATTVDALSEFSWGTGFAPDPGQEPPSAPLPGWGGGSPLRGNEE